MGGPLSLDRYTGHDVDHAAEWPPGNTGIRIAPPVLAATGAEATTDVAAAVDFDEVAETPRDS